MKREEEVSNISRLVREWAILKAKAENRSVTEVLKEMKDALEERKMESKKNSQNQAYQETDRK